MHFFEQENKKVDEEKARHSREDLFGLQLDFSEEASKQNSECRHPPWDNYLD